MNAEPVWPARGLAWWAVVVLALGLTLALMDRMIIALMIEPMKRDLGLSDTQISLIHGLAFTLTYVLAGLPLGRVADRGNRVHLAGASIVFWSAMTAVCGLTSSFMPLFLARLGVGVGEAGISPAAMSLVSDYFPPHKRTRPLAFLTIGTTAGAGIALIVGGIVVQAVSTASGITLPILGHVHTWQAVFVLLGIFGLAFAMLFLTVPEPERHLMGSVANAGVAEVVRFVASQRSMLLPQFLGPAFAVLTLIGFHSWMPTMLIRRFGWTMGQAGLVYGTLITVAGCAGVIGAGWVSERLAKQGVTDATHRVAFVAAVLAAPILAVAPLLPTATSTLVLLFPGLALVAIPSTLAPAALQAIVPNAMRGQVFSLYLLVLSFLGYALGPLSVALLTDRVFASDGALNLSLGTVASVAMPLAAICLWVAWRSASRSRQISASLGQRTGPPSTPFVNRSR